jgi:hypothetical protein
VIFDFGDEQKPAARVRVDAQKSALSRPVHEAAAIQRSAEIIVTARDSWSRMVPPTANGTMIVTVRTG